MVILKTLFNNLEIYFIINPVLFSCANLSLISHLAEDFIPAASQAPLIFIPSDNHGRSLLEKHMHFNSLLLTVRESQESLQLLGSLKAMVRPN